MRGTYQRTLFQLIQAGPALVIALPLTLATYAIWPRTRYFGNTAPLLIGILLLLFALGTPHDAGAGFVVIAIAFVFVFVSGIVADLLETNQRALVAACAWGILTASALLNVVQLARLGRG